MFNRQRYPVIAIFGLLVLGILIFAPVTAAESDEDTEEIRQLIERTYVHGAFNDLNPEELERGFHPTSPSFLPTARPSRNTRSPIG